MYRFEIRLAVAHLVVEPSRVDNIIDALAASDSSVEVVDDEEHGDEYVITVHGYDLIEGVRAVQNAVHRADSRLSLRTLVVDDTDAPQGIGHQLQDGDARYSRGSSAARRLARDVSRATSAGYADRNSDDDRWLVVNEHWSADDEARVAKDYITAIRGLKLRINRSSSWRAWWLHSHRGVLNIELEILDPTDVGGYEPIVRKGRSEILLFAAAKLPQAEQPEVAVARIAESDLREYLEVVGRKLKLPIPPR